MCHVDPFTVIHSLILSGSSTKDCSWALKEIRTLAFGCQEQRLCECKEQDLIPHLEAPLLLLMVLIKQEDKGTLERSIKNKRRQRKSLNSQEQDA